MLYNREWDKPQPKPATWASVIAWLETKDPEEVYRYIDCSRCLAAQYNKAMGREYSPDRAQSDNPFTYFSFDRRLERLARRNFRDYDSTFGSALEIAKGKR